MVHSDVGEYCSHLKSALPSAQHFVIGNEACDVDSIVSSVIWAMYLSVKENMSAIPVLNISRSDIYLRNDAVVLLGKLHIDIQSLLFFSEIDFTIYKEYSVTLVDHHILSEKRTFLQSHIVNIIDHRKTNIPSWPFNVTIQEVGSCCTLICNKITGDRSSFLENSEVSLALIAAILLDTNNLKKECNSNVKDLDFKMVNVLCNYLPKNFNPSELHKELLDARSAWSHLKTSDLLRKDLKFVSTQLGIIPINSWTFPVEEIFRKRSDFFISVNEVLCSNSYKYFVQLTNYQDATEHLKRQILIVSSSLADLKLMHVFLEANASFLKLDLYDSSSTESYNYYLYYQNYLGASRKQFIPLLEKLS